MTDTASKNNKLKLALIPFLGFVLLYVLTDGEDTEGAPAIELASRPGPGSARRETSIDRRHSDRNAFWPERSLHAIVSHNPFELTDPRAILDAEFAGYGITEVTRMTVVDPTEFFAESAGANKETELSAAGLLNAKESIETASDSAAPEFVVDTSALADEEARRARINDLQQRIRTLQNTPVTMIMTTDRGRSALLGERIIAEGEVLEEGIRAVFIGRNGVTFEIVSDTKTQ